jgi:hypothetical protein
LLQSSLNKVAHSAVECVRIKSRRARENVSAQEERREQIPRRLRLFGIAQRTLAPSFQKTNERRGERKRSRVQVVRACRSRLHEFDKNFLAYRGRGEEEIHACPIGATARGGVDGFEQESSP